jgi:hypothetical protein
LSDQALAEAGTLLQSSAKKRILHGIAAIAITVAGLLIVVLASRPAQKDYISYWSAGKLFIQGQDPYSRAGVFALEKEQGYTEAQPLIMRNPPWAVLLTVPLGFTNAATGLVLWTAMSAGCLIAFLRLLRVPSRDYAMAFLFAPALAAICAGQSSPFLLLGITLFLYLHKEKPFFAGASLTLLAIKPHIFVAFWLILLVDSIHRRSARILVGLAATLTATTALVLCLDPHVLQQYSGMLQSSRIGNEFIPTVSELFRVAINVKASWLATIPLLIGLVWSLVFYRRWQNQWDWSKQGMLLLLVALFTSPYSWFPDEIVLLPAVAFALHSSGRRKHSTEILMALNCIALFLLMVLRVPLTSAAYIWTPAAWLGWFVYATSVSTQIQDAVEGTPIPA